MWIIHTLSHSLCLFIVCKKSKFPFFKVPWFLSLEWINQKEFFLTHGNSYFIRLIITSAFTDKPISLSKNKNLPAELIHNLNIYFNDHCVMLLEDIYIIINSDSAFKDLL